MARKFIFSNPSDRSPSSPSVLISATKILGLYNQYNKDLKEGRINEYVIAWFKNQALKYGWDKTKAYGNAVLLIANIKLSNS